MEAKRDLLDFFKVVTLMIFLALTNEDLEAHSAMLQKLHLYHTGRAPRFEHGQDELITPAERRSSFMSSRQK